MLFAVSALDKPNNLEVRMAARPDHLKFWQDNDAALVMAGPYLDAAGQPMGSMIVVRAESLEEATALIDADPYAKAGVFESVTIRPWNWVLKRPADLEA